MATDNTIKVWDPLVRLFHWGLVVAFTVAYFSAEGESALHIYSGYAVLGLILFRVLWGLVGSRHARFSDFIYGPAAVTQYVRGTLTGHPRRYIGHNPLGGLMVVLMLLSLGLVTYSGLVIYAIEENAGPLAGWVANDVGSSLSPIAAAIADEDEDEDEAYEQGGAEAGEEFWEEVHEAATNFMLLLIVLHLAGVAFSSITHRENLVRAMVTGRKPANRD